MFHVVINNHVRIVVLGVKVKESDKNRPEIPVIERVEPRSIERCFTEVVSKNSYKTTKHEDEEEFE